MYSRRCWGDICGLIHFCKYFISVVFLNIFNSHSTHIWWIAKYIIIYLYKYISQFSFVAGIINIRHCFFFLNNTWLLLTQFSLFCCIICTTVNIFCAKNFIALFLSQKQDKTLEFPRRTRKQQNERKIQVVYILACSNLRRTTQAHDVGSSRSRIFL